MSYPGTHTLRDVMRAHATRSPDAPALIGPQHPPLSYGQLAAEMDAVRATLNGWGIGRGDRVALIVASHAEAIVAYVCVAAATTVFPLTPDLTEAELEQALRRSAVQAVIASQGLEQVHEVARKLELPLIGLVPKPAAGTGAFDLSGGSPAAAALPGPAEPDDIATVLMSSGTTAEPKLIPLTHALVVHRAEVERDYFQLSPRDVCINFRQPYLAGSLHGGLYPALVGGGSFVVPDHFDPDELLDGLARFGVTWFTCGTVHLDALLARAPAHQDAIKRSRLRFIRAAGAHLPSKLLEKVEATFGVICVEAYATTEGGTITCTPMPPARRKPGTVGVPSGCEVAILGDGGERLPAGEDGEIAARGRRCSPAMTATIPREPPRCSWTAGIAPAISAAWTRMAISRSAAGSATSSIGADRKCRRRRSSGRCCRMRM
jgi:acyl-CoA synthetase (AMP-forming)/AMP-acid ligase II